jgi:hypothetical protein
MGVQVVVVVDVDEVLLTHDEAVPNDDAGWHPDEQA